MRTEYLLYGWLTDDAVWASKIGTFQTLDEARAATGFGEPGMWRESPSGGWMPGPAMEGTLHRKRIWYISPQEVPETDAERIQLAVKVALEFGQEDGEHHKMWVIDQMLRYLTGDAYEQTIVEYRAGVDGPDTYSWDEGIAP